MGWKIRRKSKRRRRKSLLLKEKPKSPTILHFGGEPVKKMKNTAVLIRSLMLFCLGCFQALLILLAVAMIKENVIWPGGLFLIYAEVFLIGFGIFLIHCVPVVTLEEDGIRVKKFFKTHLYPWNRVEQAGYQWTRGTYGTKYKDLVLVLRNTGEMIHLPPLSEEVRLFVESHHGPLDFDRTEEKREP